MKPLRLQVRWTVTSVLIALAACAPSPGAVQTAIAQTQAAAPTATTLPTSVPLSKIRLDDVLLQDGDMPAGVVGGQIQRAVPRELASLIGFDNTILRDFSKGAQSLGYVLVVLYESESNVSDAYSVISAAETADTDPLAWAGQTSSSIFLLNVLGQVRARLVFTRCHAVVYINMDAAATNTDMSIVKDIAVNYGRRLDTRLQMVVCP